MSYSSQAIAHTVRKPFMGADAGKATKPEGERFTPLCSREGRKVSARKKRRAEEAFSAICFPGWRQA